MLRGGEQEMTPAEILDIHAAMSERFRKPDRAVTEHAHRWMNKDDAASWRPDSKAYYPVLPGPGGFSPERAREFCKILGLALFTARTYEITAEFVRMAMQVKTEEDKVMFLAPEELPGPSGFIWLDEPFPLYGSADAPPDAPRPEEFDSLIRVISWSPQLVRTETGDKECVRISLWTTVDDVIALGQMSTEPAKTSADLKHWGQRIGESQADFLRHDAPPLFLAMSDIYPLNTEMQTTPGSEHTAPALLRFLHSLWMLLGTTVSRVQAAPVPRSTARRAVRSLQTAAVHVVTLRKLAADDHEPGARQVDWSCRWLVQGHYRHFEKQEHRVIPDKDKAHCLVCGIRITKWIKPYLKGPDGAPLKLAETPVLYKLRR
jgi:hypothetical protein